MSQLVGSSPATSRQVYRHDAMARVFHPASVAIVGASPREGSFGSRLEANLANFAGELFLVNGRYDQIGSRQAYPSLSALPQVPDCVVIAASRDAVEGIVDECLAIGAGGAIVFASGYAETGNPEHIELQRRLGELAQGTDLRIVGPNSIGLCNFVLQANLTFGPVPKNSRPHGRSVGVVSQSGAIGQGLMQAIEHGSSISHVLATGNSCDVDVADLVSYLADDDECAAIACVFEGLSDPLRMLEAANIAAAVDKPLVVYKMATGQQGAAAAMSHTGSLAGSDDAYRAMFEQAGAVIVERIEELVETAMFFAKAPRPTAPGVAVISTSGGHAVISADKAETHGVSLPQPDAATQEVLLDHIPDFGSAVNPCDITAQVLNDPQSLAACMNALMADASYGILVHPHPVAYDAATPRIATLGTIAHEHGKFACVVWMNQWLEGPGAREAESNPDIALFRSMDSCFRTIAAWNSREAARAQLQLPQVDISAEARARVGARLTSAPGRVLSERSAKPILADYGIDTIPERLVASREAGLAAAHEFGYPVAMKVDSAQIPHKTEAGVVRINVTTDEEFTSAYDDIVARALAVTTADLIDGVLVQPMAQAGVEVMVGGRIDPQFGALVVVGLGGIFVEVLKDTAIALAPVGPERALSMISALRHGDLLRGFRGVAPVDLQALALTVARVSELIHDHAGQLEELDVNPLICSGRSIVAVDALIVLKAVRKADLAFQL